MAGIKHLNVLVKTYTSGSETKVIPLEGQGIKDLHIRCPKDGRNIRTVGTVYKVDLTEFEEFHFLLDKNLSACYFAPNDKDPLVKQFIEARLASAPLPTVEAKITIPSNLHIDPVVWDMSVDTVRMDKYILLIGPKGCGKTETARSLAKAMGYKFLPFNAAQAQKPKKFFVGGLQSDGAGKTYFVPSEFYTAFASEEKTIIFIDEASRIPQGASNYTMTIIDREQDYIYNEDLGTRIFRGKDVIFMAAANFGIQYTDTRSLDGAWLDRFIKIPIDYLPEDKELHLIMQRRTMAKKEDVRVMIKRANAIRAAEKAGNISTGVSTRQLLDMAHYLEKGYTLEKIHEKIFINLFLNGNVDERAEAKQIMQAV